jgi:hypothetical protein
MNVDYNPLGKLISPRFVCFVASPRAHSLSDSAWFTPQLLYISKEVRARFPAPPDSLRSSGFGTGPTQPREYN